MVLVPCLNEVVFRLLVRFDEHIKFVPLLGRKVASKMLYKLYQLIASFDSAIVRLNIGVAKLVTILIVR